MCIRDSVSSEEKIVVTGLTDADHRSGGITPMQSALLLFVLVAACLLYTSWHPEAYYNPGAIVSFVSASVTFVTLSAGISKAIAPGL